MAWISSHSVRQLCCASLLVLSTLPALRGDFLFSDDYYWFDLQHSRPWDGPWEADMMTIMNGRPVHGWLFIASFPLVATPEGWVVLRGIGVVFLIVTAWAFARVLRRVWEPAVADWVATAVVALPGFTLFTFWLITVPCMLAATCGALAAELALRKSWWLRAVAGVLLILGLANYQPFALVFFALLAAVALRGEIAIAAYAVGVGAIAIYYAGARLLIDWYDFDMIGRGELAFQPVAKAKWLFGSALPFASKLWSIALPPAIGLAVLGAVTLFCSWRLRDQLRALWPRILFVLVAGGTTILPHLSVRETVTRWRTLLPLSVLLALLVLVAFDLKRWPRGLLVAAVVGLLGLRALELERYGVLPEQAVGAQAAAELRRVVGSAETPNAPEPTPGRAPEAIETSVSAATSARADLGVFVLRATGSDRACVRRLSDDEFTAPSSQRDYAVAGILRLAAGEHRLPLPAAIAQGEDPREAKAPVIDLRRIRPEICERLLR